METHGVHLREMLLLYKLPCVCQGSGLALGILDKYTVDSRSNPRSEMKAAIFPSWPGASIFNAFLWSF